MDIRQLEYLVTIADEANFTRAAEKLYVSQPALTQQIQKLEKEMDTILFDRSLRQVRLTASGEIVYRHAQNIFREVQETRREVEELQSLERGTLRIGVVQTVNAYLMPGLVARFKRSYPGIRLFVEELAMDAIEIALENGHLQTGIGFLPLSYPSTEAEPLFTERLVLLTSQQHPIAKQNAIALEQITDDMLMLSRDFCTRRLWDTYADEAGVQSNISIEMNTIHSILETLHHTDLISILPELAMQMSGAEGLAAIPIHSPEPERTVSILWRAGAYRSLAAQAFAEMTRSLIQENYALPEAGD